MPGGVTISGRAFPGPRVETAFRRAAEQQMRRGMALVDGEIRRRAPFRTGHLRQSLTFAVHREGNLIIGMVGTTTKYAPYLEMGTGIYGPKGKPIVPVKAKALRFPAGGTASVFSGGARQQGSAGPGFRLSGQQRAGKAGANASFTYRRSVKGVKPRRFFKDGVEVGTPAAKREIMVIPVVAHRILEGLR